MRFGGISADESTAWLEQGLAPPWAQATIVQQDLAELAVLRLTAPTLHATAGVRLGGRGVSAAGRWSHQTPLPRVSGKPGSLELNMQADSAALVTLYPRR